MNAKIENSPVLRQDLTDDFLEIYSSGNLLSVDCEMMGLHPHRDRLCLVQLCNKESKIALVKIEPETKAPNLTKVLENPKIKKLFHFARTDLTFLYHWLGIDVKNIFCTKTASKLVRTYTDKHSLKDLVKELLNTDLSKTSQLTDWGAEALTKEQVKYAAYDVLYLIPVYYKLVELLKRENRTEIAEEANRFLPTLTKLDLWGYEDFFAH